MVPTSTDPQRSNDFQRIAIIFPDLNNDERFLLDLKAAFLGEDAEDLFLLVDDPINFARPGHRKSK